MLNLNNITGVRRQYEYHITLFKTATIQKYTTVGDPSVLYPNVRRYCWEILGRRDYATLDDKAIIRDTEDANLTCFTDWCNNVVHPICRITAVRYVMCQMIRGCSFWALNSIWKCFYILSTVLGHNEKWFFFLDGNYPSAQQINMQTECFCYLCLHIMISFFFHLVSTW